MEGSVSRAVIVHGNGAVTLADGKIAAKGSGHNEVNGTPYDLDAAFRRGAALLGAPVPIGPNGTSLLVFVDEPLQ